MAAIGKMTSCSETWNFVLNVFSIIAYSISCLLFIGIGFVHYRARRDLHPLFMTSFLGILLSYASCDFFAVLHQFITFINESPDESTTSILTALYMIYQGLYIITSPFVIITLVERCCATIYTNSYEYSRPWGPFIAAVITSLGIVFIHEMFLEYASNIFLTQVVLLVVSVVILVCLTALLLTNRQLVIKSRAKFHLSKRYQITENIKSLRLLVPVVVLDTLVSITDMVGLVFFSVDSAFEMDKCAKSAIYLPAYIICRLLSLIFEVLIPVAVIHRHHAFRRAFEKYVRKPSSTTLTGTTVHYDKRTLKIKNILGMDISPSDNIDHFDVLQQHWMKKF